MSAKGMPEEVIEKRNVSFAVRYDRAEALARLGGDEELLADVATLFIAESEDYCRALELALAVADAAAVQREAHTVKSMLATFSCESGRQRAFELEQLGASGQLAGAAALVAEVSLMIRALAQVLEKDARGAV